MFSELPVLFTPISKLEISRKTSTIECANTYVQALFPGKRVQCSEVHYYGVQSSEVHCTVH